MNLGNAANGFCANTAELWQFVGQIVMVFKIVIPVILIVLGIIALGKAVLANEDKEIKTAVNGLIKKFITAICIFFVPTIVSGLFSAINGFSEVKQDYEVCVDCITSPNGNACKTYIK